MRKRIIWISLSTLLCLGLYAGVRVAVAFYFLFPNSTQLFSWKYRFAEPLVFHSDRWQYQAEDTVSLFISAQYKDSIQLSLYRLPQKKLVSQQNLRIRTHQTLDPHTSQAGTQWKKNAEISLPSDIQSGWHLVELTQGKRRAATSVFVAPDSITQPSVTLLLSTNTWNAYNPWGGQSLYTRNHSSRASFLRPQPLSDPFLPNTLPNYQLYYQSAARDLPLLALLDSADIPTEVYPVSALEAPDSSLFQYDALIITTHSEYWTPSMITHLNAYLDQGGSLISLSGNTAAYVSNLVEKETVLEVFKADANLWKESKIDILRPFGTETFLTGIHTYAPYEVLVDSSWVFEGTGLKRGDLFGQVSDTYDYTHMHHSWLKNLQNLFFHHQQGAASGLEVDKIGASTPENWQTLARGLNHPYSGAGEVYPETPSHEIAHWDKTGGADLGYYQHPGGGMVFNVSSLAFTGAIPHDARIRQMILNVVNQALNPKP